MTGPRISLGLKISHLPLCRPINFGPSLTTGQKAWARYCSVLSLNISKITVAEELVKKYHVLPGVQKKKACVWKRDQQ